jgi:DNA (cytosine-5)-methyltransferase 1
VIRLTEVGPVAETRTAISLFSGCGGLDLGVEEAGFEVAAAVEIDTDAADTMEKNFPSLRRPVIRRDIRTVSGEELLEAAGLGPEERPDLLVGGPPCVAFSKSGFWLDYKRDGQDPAAGLLLASVPHSRHLATGESVVLGTEARSKRGA